ncbi:anthranilate phosphoribosyltransferase [Paenibacillus mucilaginosus]|uniref:Anthranilate phosphoribosyltransferase n=3 Tax=Paenibacillus mucilaginosus TaxID=61624 RepID=H6NAH7_9BACL|nr:anthranilate phosphoribosyltransferase [Paenibacillus mucilaginosus]AEI41353.1 anthranilate phosphoribosyltransferase [Paenibacillus mucilaginosus KNP414]AFC29902.1 anthranilate phosphoribosyltransferase [Paenibacillus mucilaginosus 3016]AFH62087.1 anthranilate phosphoribosyltransferase [Paenibacillus mucilaginosus K02]MCG7211227.1 anthranilate phosphoribosyltransferase [Paenibacillus mucilaginosus]WDM30379.1 anthranilate phosphoribosyltransferase [Paenibacillus mucilaginosus]
MEHVKLSVQGALQQLIAGQHLSRAEARDVMSVIMEGGATPTQIGSLLTGLRMKGETIEEITGFAEVMRLKSGRVRTSQENLLDTCGTGGDGADTFNISTAAAIVAAAGGIRVAKHGNRAMSSKSGSADVLEALGVNIQLGEEQAARCLEEVGICFMFAQNYHQSMKHVAPSRRELGFRTVFNLLGPLTNPAGADRQVLGVFDRGKTETIAHVMQALGVKRSLVVASFDGLDEISISDATQVTELRDGSIRTFEISPDDLGLRTYPQAAVVGGDAAENAHILRAIFAGEQGAPRDIVLANAGACFYVTGLSGTLQEGVKMAAAVIDSGRAQLKLQQLIQCTGEVSHVS